ncbi:hypothetical protein BGX21_001961 [Mortierella sp. AD011]|nr:hypothetical protein BGX20_001227 [Mortierella sp. AD010]KAF9381978.1 hypothetical protein BGX21_001961 [Mortierella sp. AD011]
MKITLAAALTVLCLTGAKAQSWCTTSDKLFGSCDRPDWRSKWIFKAFDHCYCSGKQLLNEQGYVNFEHCYPNVNPGSFFLQVADGFQCDVTVFANNNCDYGGQTFYGKGNTVQNYFAASANSIRLSCWGN